jgi:adenylate kinase
MFNLILFGPPGSGKGTQSARLVEKYKLTHISTGELLRDQISKGTPLGKEAAVFIDKGQLVPDAVVIGMISSILDKDPQAKGFLFDGFPRTYSQAEELDNLLKLKKTEIDLMLSLEVSEEELVKRLLKRGETSGRSDDNDSTVIRARIVEYYLKTSVVEDYYKYFGKSVRVKGEGSVDQIFDSLCKEIESRVLSLTPQK